MKTYPWQMWTVIFLLFFGVAFVAYWVGFFVGVAYVWVAFVGGRGAFVCTPCQNTSTFKKI